MPSDIFKAVSLCSYIHSPFCLSVLAVAWHVLGGASPLGAWVWFFKDSFFSALHCAHLLGGWVDGRQASEAGSSKQGVGKRGDCDVHHCP